MPAGWVTVLQMVPWGEVIKNAPKVADGAVKLWNSVSKKKVYDETGSEVSDVILASDPEAVEKLEHRLHAAEQTISDLQTQVVQSAEVIKELASQNTQLVAQIEATRKAVTVLGVALALALVAGVVQAVILFGAWRHANSIKQIVFRRVHRPARLWPFCRSQPVRKALASSPGGPWLSSPIRVCARPWRPLFH